MQPHYVAGAASSGTTSYVFTARLFVDSSGTMPEHVSDVRSRAQAKAGVVRVRRGISQRALEQELRSFEETFETCLATVLRFKDGTIDA
jgi:hypothetical protein